MVRPPVLSCSSIRASWPAVALWIVAAVTSACSPGAGPSASGPLRCARPTHDFGRVFEGQVLEHEFTVEVLAPGRIDAARSDCGCTVARLEVDLGAGRVPHELSSELTAGATLFVQARFDSRGRPGLAQRSITLVGDGPALPLQFLAQVDPLLESVPGDLEPARLLAGQEAERRFRVRSTDGRRFGLHPTGRAIPPAVAVSLEALEPDAAGRSATWEARIHVGSEVPRGSHTYPIELESDLAVPGVEGRFFSVAPPWNVQALGPVGLSTPSLEFGVVRPDEVVARTVRLESFEPGFRLEAPSARLEPLSWADGKDFPLGRTARVHARPGGGGRWCDFELSLDGLDPAVTANFLAHLVVETGHPSLGQLTAVVRGTRAPGSLAPGPPRSADAKERP